MRKAAGATASRNLTRKRLVSEVVIGVPAERRMLNVQSSPRTRTQKSGFLENSSEPP